MNKAQELLFKASCNNLGFVKLLRAMEYEASCGNFSTEVPDQFFTYFDMDLVFELMRLNGFYVYKKDGASYVSWFPQEI